MAQQRLNLQAPIERLFAKRWSTRAFDGEKPVAAEMVASCLEAARWAPSCYGEEPWRYVVADRFRDEASWNKALAALAPKNRLWAQQAPVLIVAAAEPLFSRNGKPNRWAQYDTGQATICLCLQAAALGLATHQMGGFDQDAVKQALAIPDRMTVMSVTALGHPGDVEGAPEEFRLKETAPRTRKPLSEIVHVGRWDIPMQVPSSAGWEARYQETQVEQLPWFQAGLDADFEQALTQLDIKAARILDIGCGPGTQAVALAQQGFEVTACDVSWSAVESARRLAEAARITIDFHVDDVLDSRLAGPFDLVFDRGVFHCFADAVDQEAYLATVKRLLKPKGLLLLKCFHEDETREEGPPGRYGEADICRLFADGFELLEACASRFASATGSEPPKALFCILRKR
jgi:nitroreductase/SAM-dependent methyltransferase